MEIIIGHPRRLFCQLLVLLWTICSCFAFAPAAWNVRSTRLLHSSNVRRGVLPTLTMKSPGSKSPLDVVICGAPASGKGTQCEMIKSEFGLVHLSTGDILRAAVQEGTELGKTAKGYMDAGQLVPDELIIDVICARLKQEDCQTQGWLLDGFPRTKAQADALTKAGMVPDCFLMLDVPEEVLVERVTGRRTDPVTGKIYHMTFKPPETPEIAARLVQRSDDTEEKIRVRFREFQSHVAAITSCYADKMERVDGTVASADVSKCIGDILESVTLKKLGVGVRIKDDDIKGGSGGGGGGGGGGSGMGRLSTALKAFPTTTAMGMLSLIALDKMLIQFFRTKGWTFPSSLAGMVGVFGSLLAIQKTSPTTAEKLSEGLSPAVSLIKAWLPMFFVPPLVVLPLKMHLLRSAGTQLFQLILVGAMMSLASAGLMAESMQKLLPSKSTTPSAPVKTAPLPALPSAIIPCNVVMASLAMIKLAPAYWPTQPLLMTIFGGASTAWTYLLGTEAPAGVKTIMHPVLTAAFLTMSFLGVLGHATGRGHAAMLAAYYGSGSFTGAGDLISSMLGPAIISFGVQLYQYRVMLLENATRMLATTMFSAGFGLTSSATLAKMFAITPTVTALAPLTRCITTPLALAGARLTGADPSLSALIVVLTGIFGASVGEQFLSTIGVKDPVSVGVAMGASAHGLGTAALAYDPIKFASAVVSMTLTGLWTVALMAHAPTLQKIKQLAL